MDSFIQFSFPLTLLYTSHECSKLQHRNESRDRRRHDAQLVERARRPALEQRAPLGRVLGAEAHDDVVHRHQQRQGERRRREEHGPVQERRGRDRQHREDRNRRDPVPIGHALLPAAQEHDQHRGRDEEGQEVHHAVACGGGEFNKGNVDSV